MNNKKINIIEILLHIVSLVLLFVQGMFYCYIERKGESNQRVHNAFTDLPSGNVLPTVFVILIVLSVFFCILALVKIKKKFYIMHVLLPIAATVIYILIGILYSAGVYTTLAEQLSVVLYSGSSRYSVGPIFYVEVIVLITICIIAIVKRKWYCKKENSQSEKIETEKSN